MEGAYPYFATFAQHIRDALFHFARGFVRESNRKYVVRIDVHIFDKVSDARRKYARFSAARPGKHQKRAFRIDNGTPLFFVQIFKNG